MAKKRKNRPKPRGVWQINPKTRVKPSAKIYQRHKVKRRLKKILKPNENLG